MTSEQGLVERLKAVANELIWYRGHHTVTEAADRLEAQSAQIAELQAEVERTNLSWEQTSLHLGAALRQIADLKRALDTARHDAMEEAKALADRYAVEPDPDEDDPYDDYGMGSRSTARCISRDLAALKTKEPRHG